MHMYAFYANVYMYISKTRSEIITQKFRLENLFLYLPEFLNKRFLLFIQLQTLSTDIDKWVCGLGAFRRTWILLLARMFPSYISACQPVVPRLHTLIAAKSTPCLHVEGSHKNSVKERIATWRLNSLNHVASLTLWNNTKCKVCFGIIWSEFRT